jgi:hypothetical protein
MKGYWNANRPDSLIRCPPQLKAAIEKEVREEDGTTSELQHISVKFPTVKLSKLHIPPACCLGQLIKVIKMASQEKFFRILPNIFYDFTIF